MRWRVARAAAGRPKKRLDQQEEDEAARAGSGTRRPACTSRGPAAPVSRARPATIPGTSGLYQSVSPRVERVGQERAVGHGLGLRDVAVEVVVGRPGEPARGSATEDESRRQEDDEERRPPHDDNDSGGSPRVNRLGLGHAPRSCPEPPRAPGAPRPSEPHPQRGSHSASGACVPRGAWKAQLSGTVLVGAPSLAVFPRMRLLPKETANPPLGHRPMLLLVEIAVEVAEGLGAFGEQAAVAGPVAVAERRRSAGSAPPPSWWRWRGSRC